MPAVDVGFLVTCEHGGNRIPPRYAKAFAAHRALLDSHRGWDAGALPLARQLAKALDAPLIASETSRLLVDLNRSEHHRAVFSSISRALPDQERAHILDEHYRPYRADVVAAVAADITGGKRVIHLSAHSFTPVLDGETRKADIGLLYDPRRRHEATMCNTWVATLTEALPDTIVRRNYPYRGNADGLTTALRRMHRADRYVGIEVELNQRLLTEPATYRKVCDAICATVHSSADR
jgi:predicted N-formylglutamate amidohydrolase